MSHCTCNQCYSDLLLQRVIIAFKFLFLYIYRIFTVYQKAITCQTLTDFNNGRKCLIKGKVTL